jgi:hypothetical protein
MGDWSMWEESGMKREKTGLTMKKSGVEQGRWCSAYPQLVSWREFGRWHRIERSAQNVCTDETKWGKLSWTGEMRAFVDKSLWEKRREIQDLRKGRDKSLIRTNILESFRSLAFKIAIMLNNEYLRAGIFFFLAPFAYCPIVLSPLLSSVYLIVSFIKLVYSSWITLAAESKRPPKCVDCYIQIHIASSRWCCQHSRKNLKFSTQH